MNEINQIYYLSLFLGGPLYPYPYQDVSYDLKNA